GAEAVAETADDGGLLLDGACAKGRADDREASDQEQREVDLTLRAAHEPDLDQAAPDGERRDVLREVLGADVIEDAAAPVAAGQLLHARREVLGLVVDGRRGAERLAAPRL